MFGIYSLVACVFVITLPITFIIVYEIVRSIKKIYRIYKYLQIKQKGVKNQEVNK